MHIDINSASFSRICLFQNEVKTSVYLKRRLLSRAFELLKEKINEAYVITKETWVELMKTLRPHLSSLHVDLLFYVLDDTGDHKLGRLDPSSAGSYMRTLFENN